MSTQIATTVMETSRPAAMPLLQRALQIDAIYILVASIGFIIDTFLFSELLGIPSSVLAILAAINLPYAVYLWWAITHQPLRSVGWVNVTLNYVWVLGSIALLVGGWLPLTSIGFWMVVGLAVLADILGSVQAYALIKRK